VKRKAIIGIVLALVVGVVLGLALRWEDERPPLRFTYLGLSPTNTNHVVFRVTKIDTNFMCVLMLDEQIADDIWESQTNPPPQLIQAFDHFEETPNLPVPLTTNLWRPTAYFYRAQRHLSFGHALAAQCSSGPSRAIFSKRVAKPVKIADHLRPGDAREQTGGEEVNCFKPTF
jgi:hypothetical protein